MELEAWRPVAGFDGLYDVSDLGRIRSTYRGGRVLVGNIDGRGYNRLWLWKGKQRSKHSLHRLVALAFLPNPDALPCINHVNANRVDNRATNLEWCTFSHNIRHAFAIGTMRGSSAPRPKRKRAIIQGLPDGARSWPGVTDASKGTGISITGINNCARGRSRTAGGFTWRYL